MLRPNGNRTITKCKLINGEIVEYDACSRRKRNSYSKKVFSYIGAGTIYSIMTNSGREVLQTELNRYHFYVKRY